MARLVRTRPSMRGWTSPWRRAGLRESLVALVLAAVTSLVAGLTLAAATGTLEDLPGLLLLVPAAIGMRGNIFGALGSRLGTAIHAGTFRLTARSDTVVGQNVLASLALTLVLSVALGLLANLVAIIFSIGPTMTTAQFVTVSIVGGELASIGVLIVTLGLAAAANRWSWDLDNVIAPLVTAAGDVLTLPALVVGAWVAQRSGVAPVVLVVSLAVTVVVLVASIRSSLAEFKRILVESIPVLVVAGVFDLVAGVTVEKRLDAFVVLPALLVLVPGYFETAGALGGILSSRLSTKFHLGLADPTPLPGRLARGDMAEIFALAVPVFALVATVAHVGGTLTGHASPGLADMVLVAVIGGIIATLFVVAVAYYGTIAAVRLGADPDSLGIPLVTSALDLVGAFTLVMAALLVGVI